MDHIPHSGVGPGPPETGHFSTVLKEYMDLTVAASAFKHFA